MAALNLKSPDFTKVPKWARAVIVIVPAAIIIAVGIFVFIKPKVETIKQLEAKVATQAEEINKKRSMALRLDELKKEYESLQIKLKELKSQLPDESEISSLLKQVSELGGDAGLKILTWKPEARKVHSSGIVYEVPVSVNLTGSYHRMGIFFSTLTQLDRVVNISDIKLGTPKYDEKLQEVVLKVDFKAVTFVGVPEGETPVKAKGGPKK